jgi:hypothetical protein
MSKILVPLRNKDLRESGMLRGELTEHFFQDVLILAALHVFGTGRKKFNSFLVQMNKQYLNQIQNCYSTNTDLMASEQVSKCQRSFMICHPLSMPRTRWKVTFTGRSPK